METLSREFYLTDATQAELDERAQALRQRRTEQILRQYYGPPGPLFRAWRWLRRQFDGDYQEVDLETLRQLDAIVSAHVIEFGTSRAVGPIMKKRLREFNLRYKALRSGLVR